MQKTNPFYQRLNDYVGIIFICVMLIAVAVQVFYRYVLNNPLPWPEELARYLFVWITYIGLVKVVRENSHYRIDFLLLRMPKRLQILFEIFFDSLVVLLLLLALYGSFALIKANRVILSPAMQVPIIVVYLALPVTALLMLPQLINFIIGNFRQLRSKNYSQNVKSQVKNME